MSRLPAFFLLAILGLATEVAQAGDRCPTALDFEVQRLNDSEQVRLCDAYRGKVLLVVNTASKCGFTPQYDGLETLYERYRERGLVVLGFPSNDFAGQEPGSEQQIQAFCRLTYGVKFPMFAKTRVAQGEADPFYESLAELAGEYPRWNFHKYLLDRQGDVAASFPTRTPPESVEIVEAIERLL